jgi:hypothetical protein
MSKSFEERNLKDFNNKLLNIFNLMTINGKYSVIGSSVLKKIKYNSDYDLDELIKDNSSSKTILNNIHQMFLQKFQEAIKEPNIYITDFKCGEEKNGEPLRWEYDDLKKGFQKINGSIYYFQDCILQKSTIKLDVIALINGNFTEFSDNYYFRLGNHGNFNPKEITRKSVLKSLKQSFDEEYNEKNYYKSLKRSFAYNMLKSGKSPKLEKLVNFFNSDIGILNKARSDLDVLILILQNEFRKPKLNDIKINLQIIKQQLSYNTEYKLNNISSSIDKICKSSSLEQIEKNIQSLSDMLSYIVNKSGLKYIMQNKNLII